MAWVERKKFADKVKSLRWGGWDQLLQGLSLDVRISLLHVLQEILVSNFIRLNFLTWHSEERDQEFEVLLCGSCFNKNSLVKELGNDATKRPHVDSSCVVGLKIEVELWGSVVPGGHILGQVVVLVNVSTLDIGLSEVTDLDVPVVVHQDVQRLHVTMDHTFRVHEKHSFSNLIDHVLNMISVHGLCIEPDDISQVLGAILSDNVQVIEALGVCWTHDGFHLHNIVVALEQTEEAHLSQHSVSIYLVLEKVLDLFDSHSLAILLLFILVP